MSSESRLTRDGEAREVIYAWGSATAQELQLRADAHGRSACAVHIEDLFVAFTLGIDTYLAEVERDVARMSNVMKTLESVFTDVAIR
jgi:hypothetical protein